MSHRAPASVQELLLLEDIVGGVVCLRGGQFRGVMEAQSISLALRSPGEQEAIIAGYRSFLNSLSYPLQLIVRILRTDMQPYLATLRACTAGQDVSTLHRLAVDHEAFLRRLAKTTTLLERRFYVVIPANDEAEHMAPASWWPWTQKTSAAYSNRRETAARLPYTEPAPRIKLAHVPWPGGTVGLIEVVREAEKVPYRVKKGLGGRGGIKAEDIFVRHGSHTEEPTTQELQDLTREGDRARDVSW